MFLRLRVVEHKFHPPVKLLFPFRTQHDKRSVMTDLLGYALPVALGVGLAAAAGFRVFLPLLVMGLAVKGGYLPVSDDFLWVASTPALLMFAVAAFTEVIAYYVPVLDNLLDGIAGPTAVGAGIAISAAVMGDFPPMLKWTLAIIAGGGAADRAGAAAADFRPPFCACAKPEPTIRMTIAKTNKPVNFLLCILISLP